MAIELKVICNQGRLADILWLRHQVYVLEEGRYGGDQCTHAIRPDLFDLLPRALHLIVYDDRKPIATLRVNADIGFGLPVDAHFDFRPYVAGLMDGDHCRLRQPVTGSAGMLAVRRDWRRQRRVLPELYRAVAHVLRAWGVTHIVAMVSLDTLSLYGRLGFLPVAGKIWLQDIQDHVIPIVARASDCYRLASTISEAPIHLTAGLPRIAKRPPRPTEMALGWRLALYQAGLA